MQRWIKFSSRGLNRGLLKFKSGDFILFSKLLNYLTWNICAGFEQFITLRIMHLYMILLCFELRVNPGPDSAFPAWWTVRNKVIYSGRISRVLQSRSFRSRLPGRENAEKCLEAPIHIVHSPGNLRTSLQWKYEKNTKSSSVLILRDGLVQNNE